MTMIKMIRVKIRAALVNLAAMILLMMALVTMLALLMALMMGLMTALVTALVAYPMQRAMIIT